jgi:hypothetical protein
LFSFSGVALMIECLPQLATLVARGCVHLTSNVTHSLRRRVARPFPVPSSLDFRDCPDVDALNFLALLCEDGIAGKLTSFSVTIFLGVGFSQELDSICSTLGNMCSLNPHCSVDIATSLAGGIEATRELRDRHSDFADAVQRIAAVPLWTRLSASLPSLSTMLSIAARTHPLAAAPRMVASLAGFDRPGLILPELRVVALRNLPFGTVVPPSSCLVLFRKKDKI